MATKTSGVKLQIEGLNQFVSGLQSASSAKQRFDQSMQSKSFDIGGGRDPFAGFAQSADRATGQISASFGRMNSFVAGIFAGLGAIAARTAVDMAKQFAGAFTGALAGSAGFQQDIANAFANFEISPEQLAKVKAQIAGIAVDPNLVAGFSDVTAAAGVLAQKGVQLNDILSGALRSTVLLQNVTGGSFETAATVAARTQSIFGISANQLQTNIGQVAGTIKTAGLESLDQYNAAISQAGGALAGLGVNFTDFNTLIGATGKLFAGGSDAGTSLKTFVTRLVPTTNTAQDALDAYNLSFVDTAGNLKSFAEISGILSNVLNGQVQVNDTASDSYNRQQKQIKSVQSTYNSLTTQILKYRSGVAGVGQSEATRAKHLNTLLVEQANAKKLLDNLAASQTKLGETTRALTQEEKVKFINEVFGADSSRVAYGLAAVGAEGYLKIQKEIAGTDAAAIAARRTQTLAAAWKTFGDTLEATGILAASPLLDPLEKTVRAITSLAALATPSFQRFGESIANAIAPGALALATLADQLSTISTTGGQFKLDFAGIKALQLGDVFAFDILGLSGYFNDQIKNINLDLGQLHFSFLTNPDLTDISLKLGDLFKAHFSRDANKTVLNVGDFIRFGISPGRTVVDAFGGFFRFDQTKLKQQIKVSDLVEVVNDSLTGEVNLQIGSFKTTFNTADLDAALQPVFDFANGIRTRLTAAFNVLSNASALPNGGSISFVDTLTAKAKAIPEAIRTAFDGLTFPDIPGLLNTKFDTLFPADFALSLPKSLDAIGASLLRFSLFIDQVNGTAQGVAGEGGVLGKTRQSIADFFSGLGASIGSIDPGKANQVGGAISGLITSLLGAVTTFNNIDNTSAAKVAGGLGDLAKGVASFATSVTTGIDGTKVGEAAGKFASSFVDLFSSYLTEVDFPGIGQAVSGLFLAITQTLKEGLASKGTTEIGQSVGAFVSTLVSQLGATLSNPKFGDDLGKGFANIVVGITQGAANLLNGVAGKLEGNTSLVDQINTSVGTFAKNFITGVAAGLAAADYGSIVSALLTGIGRSAAALTGGSEQQVAQKEAAARLAQEQARVSAQQAITRAQAVQEAGPSATAQQKQDASNARVQAGIDRIEANRTQQRAIEGNFLGFLFGLLQGKVPGITTPVPAQAPVSAANQKGFVDQSQLSFVELIAPFLQGRATAAAQAQAQTQALGAPLLTAPVVTIAPESIQSLATAAVQAQATPASRLNYQNTIAQNNSGGNGPPIAGLQDATNFTGQLDSLREAGQNASQALQGASTQAAGAITAGGAAVQAGGNAAQAQLSAVPPFPGWGTVLGPPLNLAGLVPPLNWDNYINRVAVPVPSNKVLGFAAGGSVPRTGAYLVGERGPEVALLARGTHIIPNHRIGPILGSYAQGTSADPITEALLAGGKAYIDSTIAGATIKVPVQPVVKPVDSNQLNTALNSGGNAKVDVTPVASKTAFQTAAPLIMPITPVVAAGAKPLSVSIIPVGGFRGVSGVSQPLGTGLGSDLQATINAENIAGEVAKLKQSAKSFTDTIQEIQAGLKGVPGLFGASPVTQDQLDAAKAGIPQNFADNFVRRLGAEVTNKNQEFGNLLPQAIDALQKIGVTPGANPQAILEQIKSTFASGELFSNVANLGLIDQGAVKASIDQQNRQKQGQENITNFFSALLGGAGVQDLLGGAGAPGATGRTRGGGVSGGGAETGADLTGLAGGAALPPFPGWTGQGGVIPPFPTWQAGDGIIKPFPGWAKPAGFIPFLDWATFIDLSQGAKTPGPTATTSGGAVPIAGKRAGGGSVSSGQAYLVGEKGTEIFTPNSSGTITPNAAIYAGVATGVAEAFTGFKPPSLDWGDVIKSPRWSDVVRPLDLSGKVPKLNWNDVVSSTAVVSVISVATGGSSKNSLGSVVGGSVPIGTTGGFENAGTISVTIPKAARGGRAWAGKPMIVGEQGQELFIPGANGYIAPNSAVSRLMQSPPSVTNNYSNVTKHYNLSVNSLREVGNILDEFGYLERAGV